MSTTLVQLILSLLALAAAFAGGVPVKGRADAELEAADVARRDRRLVTRLAVAATVVVVGQLLGAWSDAGAWVALAAAAGVCTPLAWDRWRRTNGDLRPYAALLLATAQEPGVERTLADDLRDQLVDELRPRIAELPESLLRTLAEIDGEPARRERICHLLAAGALRTGRDGQLVWLADDDDSVARRAALLALAEVHPDVRAQVLPTAP